MAVKSLDLPVQDDARLVSQVIDTPLRDRLFGEVLQTAAELAERPGFVLGSPA
jgi:hypothetical protein